VPPTLEERTQAAFAVPGTPLERFEKAKQLIDQVNQNLLIVFADPADIRVKSLMRIRYEDRDFRPYQDDFRFMAISTSADALGSAQDLAESLEVDAVQRDRGFLLVLLNRDGQVIAKISDDQVCDADEVSKDLLFAQLDKYKTTPLDARELLDAALATAQRENKRVIVQETATWCGPCHLLSGLLQSNRDWEKDYVWVKMDHRWTDAVEIMKQLREGADGGIPWFAILDAQGNKLATSNLPESGRNVGFPSDAQGQEHFMNMLKSTRQRMTDQEIVDLASAAKSE
jgi:thiol-disulfide isomerase/thioredoxin